MVIDWWFTARYNYVTFCQSYILTLRPRAKHFRTCEWLCVCLSVCVRAHVGGGGGGCMCAYMHYASDLQVWVTGEGGYIKLNIQVLASREWENIKTYRCCKHTVRAYILHTNLKDAYLLLFLYVIFFKLETSTDNYHNLTICMQCFYYYNVCWDCLYVMQSGRSLGSMCLISSSVFFEVKVILLLLCLSPVYISLSVFVPCVPCTHFLICICTMCPLYTFPYLYLYHVSPVHISLSVFVPCVPCTHFLICICTMCPLYTFPYLYLYHVSPVHISFSVFVPCVPCTHFLLCICTMCPLYTFPYLYLYHVLLLNATTLLSLLRFFLFFFFF